MENLVPDLLWTDACSMQMAGIPAGRRATIVRNRAGELIVFSPLPVDSGLASLKQLGEPAAFVIQSRFHDRFYDEYPGLFPRAKFLARGDALRDHRDWPLVDYAVAAAILDGLEFLEIGGMPMVQEQAFFHPATRTLIVADLFFNVPEPGGIVTRVISRLADIGGPPARPSRLWRTLIRDQTAFAASLDAILQWDFDRIMTGHGDFIARDGKAVLRAAFPETLGR